MSANVVPIAATTAAILWPIDPRKVLIVWVSYQLPTVAVVALGRGFVRLLVLVVRVVRNLAILLPNKVPQLLWRARERQVELQ